jgi:arabinan endo-1,5-alpha-L-arabinosidase
MKKLLLTLVAALGVSVAGHAQSEPTQLTTAQLSSLYAASARKSTSIHDPSVVWEPSTQQFYIYGSHYAGAKTKNFNTYTNISNYYNTTYDQAFKSSPARTVKRTLNGVTEEVEFPSFDAAAWCATYHTNHMTDDMNGTHVTTEAEWVSGDQWAPDLVWNPTMNKWCYYVSLNGDFWASVIVLMTSDNIEGPYTYQGPVVMGGFIGSNTSSENTNHIAPPSYKDSDLEIVMGTQSSLPDKYNKGKSNGTYWPNCIDPCVFFDEDGELWLAYGSWSGGIFMLKLDKETGLRDYTTTYPDVDAGSANCTSDAYFGKKIAGGYYVSGEGPYIQHIGDYYYLFMSYGGYAPDGGYEMRVFRSEKPDGPYKDASGTTATYTDVNKYVLNFGPNAATNRGMKLIGAMNGWGLMTVGECAQGHNSACQDDLGRTFLVCHTKFNNGTAGHAVRAYQLYLNKFGWLCTAPFQFNGETTTDETIATTQPWSAADIEGDYHLIIHPYKLAHENFAEAIPATIHLSADGKVTGAYSGTWKYTDEDKSYFQIKLGSYTYNGVVVEQTLEGNTAKALCFTAVCTSGTNCGVPVWGYKLQPAAAIARNYQLYGSTYLKAGLFTSVSKNVNILFAPIENVRLSWMSSMPEVLSNEGKYNAPAEQQKLTMTARLESGDYFWENTFNATAKAAAAVAGDPTSGIVAYYNFDESPVTNLFDETQTAELRRSNVSTAYPVLETDYARFGQVLHQAFGAIKYNSYTRMPNPLAGQEDLNGFTVSLWVNRADATNPWDALWSFFSGTTAQASGPRLFFTGNSYLGFNDNAGHWFDVNYPEANDIHPSGQYKVVDRIDANTWRLITVTYSKENGYTFYRDGSKYLASNMVYAGSETKDTFNRDLVLDFVKSATYFYLGLGSFWGSAEARFDDLLVYNRELSPDDVKGLNTLLNRVSPFSEGTIVGIDELPAPTSSPQAIMRKGVFDLMGRPVLHPAKGLYIIDGKKALLP